MARENLIDKDGIFTRGKHEDETLEEVAETDTEYLIWLCEISETDAESIQSVAEFLTEHPDYYPLS